MFEQAKAVIGQAKRDYPWSMNNEGEDFLEGVRAGMDASLVPFDSDFDSIKGVKKAADIKEFREHKSSGLENPTCDFDNGLLVGYEIGRFVLGRFIMERSYDEVREAIGA